MAASDAAKAAATSTSTAVSGAAAVKPGTRRPVPAAAAAPATVRPAAGRASAVRGGQTPTRGQFTVKLLSFV